jgi:hypothetical protein
MEISYTYKSNVETGIVNTYKNGYFKMSNLTTTRSIRGQFIDKHSITVDGLYSFMVNVMNKRDTVQYVNFVQFVCMNLKTLVTIKKYARETFNDDVYNKTVTFIQLTRIVEQEKLSEMMNELFSKFANANANANSEVPNLIPVVYYNIRNNRKIIPNCSFDVGYLQDDLIHCLRFRSKEFKVGFFDMTICAFKSVRELMLSSECVKYIDIVAHLEKIYFFSRRYTDLYSTIHECMFDLLEFNPTLSGVVYETIIKSLNYVYNKLVPVFYIVKYKNSKILDTCCNICTLDLTRESDVVILHPIKDSNRLHCAHFMCSECISRYSKTICPFCRQDIEYKERT